MISVRDERADLAADVGDEVAEAWFAVMLATIGWQSDGRDADVDGESKDCLNGDGVVEEPGLGVWLGGAEGCGQWRMRLAVSRAGRLELAQAILAVRLVSINGGHDTLEALLAGFADRE